MDQQAEKLLQQFALSSTHQHVDIVLLTEKGSYVSASRLWCCGSTALLTAVNGDVKTFTIPSVIGSDELHEVIIYVKAAIPYSHSHLSLHTR